MAGGLERSVFLSEAAQMPGGDIVSLVLSCRCPCWLPAEWSTEPEICIYTGAREFLQMGQPAPFDEVLIRLFRQPELLGTACICSLLCRVRVVVFFKVPRGSMAVLAVSLKTLLWIQLLMGTQLWKIMQD